MVFGQVTYRVCVHFWASNLFQSNEINIYVVSEYLYMTNELNISCRVLKTLSKMQTRQKVLPEVL